MNRTKKTLRTQKIQEMREKFNTYLKSLGLFKVNFNDFQAIRTHLTVLIRP